VTEAEVRKLFEVWAGRLGLDRWWLKVEIGSPEEADSIIEVNRSTVYERAVITVPPWVVGQADRPDSVLGLDGDDRIEASVVHELLHLITRDLVAIVRDDCDGLVHPDAYRQLDKAIHRIEEQTVDRLAEALVRAWPKGSA
jgi:hypothetical protein